VEAQAAPRVAQAGRNPVTVSPDDPDIVVSGVEFPTADGSALVGYMAMPSAPGTYPGIVVIHENRGLLEHHKDVVRRYAKAGFAAVAPDLVSREGGTENANPDEVPGFLATADPHRHVETAGVAHDFVVEPGANHAFFNDTGDRYNAQAAADAWSRALAWFNQYLAAG